MRILQKTCWSDDLLVMHSKFVIYQPRYHLNRTAIITFFIIDVWSIEIGQVKIENFGQVCYLKLIYHSSKIYQFFLFWSRPNGQFSLKYVLHLAKQAFFWWKIGKIGCLARWTRIFWHWWIQEKIQIYTGWRTYFWFL